ncbi:hypothetical protein Tco_0827144, partial [Tanacetum coccineum]
MSSSNHPTSNIEDAYSSNFSNSIPVVPDYFPASPGKTYSSASNNPIDVVPQTSSTFSLFHDDPYIKIINEYAALIPPPTHIPPPIIKPPLSDPPEFFLPKGLLSEKQEPNSPSSLPLDFEIGESSHKSMLDRHEEQIEEIINHLNELPLERFECI